MITQRQKMLNEKKKKIQLPGHQFHVGRCSLLKADRHCLH